MALPSRGSGDKKAELEGKRWEKAGGERWGMRKWRWRSERTESIGEKEER